MELLTKFYITLFIKLIDIKLKFKIVNNSQTYFDTDSNIIYISLNNKSYGFYRHVYEKHNYLDCYKYSDNIWSILHEIGHYYTIDDCDEDIDTREFCELLTLDDFNKYKGYQDLYYDMDEEWEATEWAIDFIERHKRFCKFFSKHI